MKKYKFTDDSLQVQAIELLKELGANKDVLWLVEVSSIEKARGYYSDRHIDDLVQFKADDDDSIIYFHESGSIHKHKTFNSDDPQSFKNAVAEVAEFLGGDIK